MTDPETLAQHTGKFGWIYPDSVHFNDHEKLPGNFLHFKVIKIWIWVGKKADKPVVNGIQFFYRNMLDGKEFTPGEHRGTDNFEEKHEITLASNEYITDFHIRIDQEVSQIGFTTNKSPKKLFGGDQGEDKITELNDPNKPVIIYAPFGCTKDTLQSCGVFYVNKKEFMKVSFAGYFELRCLIRKRPEFKKKCDEGTYNQSDSILLKACNLPDTAFNAIIKYCLY